MTERTSRAAIAGVAATAAALGTSELLAGLLSGATSLVAAVGQVVVDLQPPGAKDLVVSLFGTNDKLALELFIVAVAILVGAGLGVLAARRPGPATLVFVGFGIAGFMAALRDPLASATVSAATTAIAVGLGLWVLGRLVPTDPATATSSAASRPPSTPTRIRPATPTRTPAMLDWSRRGFLVRAGAVGVASVAAGAIGRTLLDRQRAAVAQVGASLPPASTVVPALDAAEDLGPTVPGLTPIVMPNDRFYRIDTALLTPTIDAAHWTLRIHGLVDRVTTLTYAELTALPMFEQYVTIACVSNEVGGKLVGNAKWTGVHLRDVLALAGVQASATQLVGRSVDGWTAGMPTAWVMDPARDPMIVVKMNDEPLPPAHGFPARLIVPGLYGYVSATKWLAELELTTLDGFDGYWIPLGWAKDGPILTQSRIDTPRDGASLGTGRVPIAGIAWAPDRGVKRVEVGIDGVWHDAQLSQPISDATWVQWVIPWDATPGDHEIAVRATDGTGTVQTQTPSPPPPDGARGWHTIDVHIG